MPRNTPTKNALFLLVGTALGNLFVFSFQVLVAREFGSASYGIFTIASSILMMTATVAMVGYQDALIKFVGEYRDDPERLAGTIRAGFGLPLSISIVISGLLYLVADPLARLAFESTAIGQFIKLFSLALPAVVGMRLAGATLLGFERAGRRVLTEQVTKATVLIVGTSVVVVLGGSFLDVGTVYVASLWISAIVGVFLVFQLAGSQLREKPTYDVRGMLAFSLPLMLSGQLGLISNWIDTILVGVITTSQSLVGVYQSAFLLGTSALIFMKAITGSLYPNFSKLIGAGKSDLIKERHREATRWGVILTTAPVFYLIFFAGPALEILFGPAFVAGKTALAVIVLGNLGGVAVGPATGVIKADGNSRFVLFSLFLALLVNIILNITLIPAVGIVGAAIGTAMATITSNSLHFFRARKLYSISVPYTVIGQSLGAGAVAVAVTFPLINFVTGFFLLVGNVLLFTVAYCFTLYILGGFDSSDLQRLAGNLS